MLKTTIRVAIAVTFCLAGSLLAAEGPASAPATAPATPSLIPAGVMDAGLVVTVGISKADDLAALAADGRRLIYALVADSAAVAPLRSEMHTRGLAGFIVVESMPSHGQLPFATNGVDAVLCDPSSLGAAAPTADELLRITAPYGVTMARSGTAWTRTVKPRPAAMDDWCSYYGGPGQNPQNRETVAPFTQPRWLSTSGNVVYGGMRINGPWAANGLDLPGNKHTLQVRRAFSGVPTIETDLTQDPGRELTMIGESAIYRPVDRGPLVLLNVHTGSISSLPEDLTAVIAPETTPGDKKKWVGMRKALSRIVPLGDGGFLTSYNGRIARFRPDGSLAWVQRDAGLHLPVVDGDLVIGVKGEFEAGPFGDPTIRVAGLLAIRLADGAAVWQSPVAVGGVVRRFYGAAQGCIAFSWLEGKDIMGWHGRSNNVSVIESATGKLRWEKKAAAFGVTTDTLILPDRLLMMTVADARQYKLTDGTVLPRLEWPQWNCQEARASSNFLLTGLTFIDLARIDVPGHSVDPRTPITPAQAKGVTRASCNIGAWPANGLVYSTPTNCTCFSQWRGNVALSADPLPAPLPDDERLQRGPAFADAAAVTDLPSDGWRSWLAGNLRTAGVEGDLPAKPAMLWRTAIAAKPRSGPIAREWANTDTVYGRISQATIADGRAFVSLPDEHRVAALDLATGALAWSFLAGGRVDAPPTLAGNTAYFGCRDGYVYALDAATGALRWRYLAAPSRRTLVMDGHLESMWPVNAPVLIHDGSVFAVAGIHSGFQPGLTVVRLDARSGAATWRSPIYSGDFRTTIDGKKDKAYVETLSDVLVMSNGLICMGWYALDPKTGAFGPIEDKGGRLWNDRNCSVTIAGHVSRLVRVSNSRLGLLHDGAMNSLSTYDGIGSRFFALDRTGNVLFSLHGGKLRTSGGPKYSTQGTLQAWALDADGFVIGKGDKGEPVPAWALNQGDAADGSPERVGMIRVGKTLVSIERNADARRRKFPHAVEVQSTADGSAVDLFALPEAPIVNGASSDGHRLLVALTDGSVVCFGAGRP